MFSTLKSKSYAQLDEHMMEVVRGAGITFVIKVASAGFAFGFNVLLARLLGADGAGIYFLALTITTVAATIGRFGLENTLLRLVAAHAANEEWLQVRGVFRKGMLISFTVSLCISVLLYFSSPIIALQIFNKTDLEAPLRIMSLAVVPFALYWLIAEALKGLKRIRDSQLLQGLALPVLTCVGFLLIGSKFGPNGAVIVFVFGTFTLLLWGMFLWYKATPKLKSSALFFPLKRILDSCVPLFWVQLMNLVMQWSSLILLGIWGSVAEIGVFGVASKTAMLTSFILVSVNSIVAPKFSEFYAKGDMAGLSALACKSTKMMTAFASPILLVFVFAPEWVMGIFGRDFSMGAGFLTIMAVGQFVNVITGSVGYLLMMTGNERLMRNNTMVVSVMMIVLNIVLIQSCGAWGAAIATALGMATMNIGAFFLVWKRLGIWTLPIYMPFKN